jgi:hypothetical protein
MSDPDAAPDPMDKAYAQAEALLNDERDRAARRARVLAAVAREPAPPPAVVSPSTGRAAWARGGWLVAASVAGLSVLLATQVDLPSLNRPQPAPAASVITAPADTAVAAPSQPAGAAPSQAPTSVVQAPAAPSRREAPAVALSPAPAPPAVQAPAAPPAAEPSSSSGLNELVVTGGRRVPDAAPEARARASGVATDAAVGIEGPARRALSPGVAASVGSPADQAARLGAAAAAGRTADVAALLADGVSVDAVDADGETALMKSIQADHPAAAALLRRRGASLERKNHAGVSAREMASRVGDAELNQALGLDP